jgi:hypothetical protein
MSPNLLLEREIQVDRLRQVIVSDITYLPLQNGKWAYLAALDIGYSSGEFQGSGGKLVRG